ncbi:MAG: hypothetical protein MUE45_08250 [Methanoregulaceae archaeon]|nr:hypothetical protein [Methanoregulaceae archaeon]
MKGYVLVIAGFLLIIPPVIAAPVISAAIGDQVPLAGFAPGSDRVYLFLTGPNLPANGIRLDDISSPVISGDSSSFTTASVDNDRWEYTWYTRTKGGTLDAGTYTIFIVTTPVGRRDLAGAAYATIMVTLGSPGLVILPAGGVSVLSSPQSADIFPDGIPIVTTPMEFNDTMQGNHASETQKVEYVNPNSAVVIAGGETGTVERMPKQAGNPDTLSPVTTPPEKIPIPVLEVITAIGCIPGLIWFRKRIE